MLILNRFLLPVLSERLHHVAKSTDAFLNAELLSESLKSQLQSQWGPEKAPAKAQLAWISREPVSWYPDALRNADLKQDMCTWAISFFPFRFVLLFELYENLEPSPSESLFQLHWGLSKRALYILYLFFLFLIVTDNYTYKSIGTNNNI